MFAKAMGNFAPRPRWRSLSWARRFVRFENGVSFEAEKFPYLAAPGGPFDALDDPDVRRIWLQFGIRMGKTLFGQLTLQYYADVAPYNMLFASTTEQLAKQVAGRTERMAEQCPRLGRQLPHPKFRKQTEIQFDHCRIYVGWFLSASTLADKDILVGHANEVDKIKQFSTDSEGDPLDRFLDRASNKPNHKYVIESTPERRDHSRVEAGRLNSTNCHLHVPCPHCNRYQTLQLGDGTQPGGLKWDKTKDDEHDAELARRTARYICAHCNKEIHDQHRGPMIRLGVWAPEGCGINHAEALKAARRWVPRLKGTDGAAVDDHIPWQGWSQAKWVTGKPLRDGVDAGYQCSRLYDLSLTWGDIAARYIAVKGNKKKLQQFLNEWMAETWVDVHIRHTWEDLGRRLRLEYSRGTVPADAWFLTAGVDVQEDRCYWIVRAWGAYCTSWLVDWGICRKVFDGQGLSPLNSDLNQLDDLVVNRGFPVNGKTKDGYDKLWCAKICVDTGFRIRDVHQFLRDRPGDRLRAVAGDQNVRSGYFRLSVLEKDSRTGKPYEGGLAQWQLNVDAFKEETRDRFSIPVGEPGAFYFPREVLAEGQDYLKQICNEAPMGEKRVWQMIKPSWGNHHWDDEIYARAGAEFITEGDWGEHVAEPPPPPDHEPTADRRRLARRRMTGRRA